MNCCELIWSLKDSNMETGLEGNLSDMKWIHYNFLTYGCITAIIKT